MKSAADKGHPVAQLLLSDFYWSGEFVVRDEKLAGHYVQLSSAQNYLPAIGVCYHRGCGVKIDAEIARSMYRVAIDRHDLVAYYYLSALYSDCKQPELSRKAAEDGASKNDVRSKMTLAKMYGAGFGGPVNSSAAFELFQQTASLGYVSAYYGLGLIHLDEDDVKWHPVRAFRWLLKAAHQNHFAAQTQLAASSLNGDGPPWDSEEGLRWLRRAAVGNRDAQYNLAHFYHVGLIREGSDRRDHEEDMPKCDYFHVQPDLRKAIELFRSAAENGHDVAVSRLKRLDVSPFCEYASR
jgi:TPR repeat protein